MADLQEIADSIIAGQAPATSEGVSQALKEGVPVEDILHKGLIAGMNVVGVKFKSNEFYIPEVLIAARAMKAGLELIRPKLLEENVQPLGRVAIGTVKGDLHDIGKNLVAMMLEGAGFEVVDLGVDVAPDSFVESVREQGVQIICMSSLLTTTMTSIQTTIDALKAAGLTDNVRIMVGGAPITQEFADKIGADGYAADAASAADKARDLVEELKA
ncbi:MAG: corrinoid protein [Candidatus Latescibacteria bacterium]|jgi:5-methyltetrahydrofolate--homocysteine methyltransferase|nr:corrinoid protein [Candidatus Latescibacterota bacterium]